jgi:hypothetical protein
VRSRGAQPHDGRTFALVQVKFFRGKELPPGIMLEEGPGFSDCHAHLLKSEYEPDRLPPRLQLPSPLVGQAVNET